MIFVDIAQIGETEPAGNTVIRSFTSNEPADVGLLAYLPSKTALTQRLRVPVVFLGTGGQRCF